jgi:serine O-acetyltransferase
VTGIIGLIKTDYQRYFSTGRGTAHPLSIFLLTQGLWASSVYRVAHAIRLVRHKSILHRLADILLVFIQKWIEIITSVDLPADCEIGPGLYIGHFGPIIVNGRTRLGSNCNLSQGVTIGVVQRGSRQGVPVIGDRVYIGPNAVVIGGIEIGNDAAIGAGAVVTRSVPALAVVAGNPAKILSHSGSFEMVCYSGMENDPQRKSALEKREKFSRKKYMDFKEK